MMNLAKRAFKYFLWKSQLIVQFNRIIWNIENEGKNFTIDNLETEECFSNLPLSFKDNNLNTHHQQQNAKWSAQRNQIIHLCGNIYVEPQRGLVLYGTNNIASFSKIHAYTYPNFFAFWWTRLVGKVKKIDKAIYFDGYLATNYYHFFHDVLNTYWTLIRVKDYQQLPVLIGQDSFSKPYVQFVLKNTELKKLRFQVIEKGQWLQIDHLIKPVATDLSWKKSASLWSRYTKQAPFRKVFLTRSKRDGRYIRNMDEIAPILAKYHFKAVDASSLPHKEQIKLFQETVALVGIHGSGLTNILFTDTSYIKILEILPAQKLFPHYYWLSGILGAKYDAMIASQLDHKQSFEVDVVTLEKRLKQLLESEVK